MKQNIPQNIVKLFTVILLTFTFFIGSAYAENIDERDKLLAEAFEPFLKGEYEKSIKIFDEMLEIYPEDYKIFEMKGVALSNLRLESTLAMQPQQNTAPRDPSNLNKSSMLEFYKALEINPNSVLALNGMGLGFGNFGEYSEAEIYFKKSLEVNPDNKVTQNYLISLENLKKKYSLNMFENPTKKPDFLKMMEENTIPSWIKNNAGWWADNKINDNDFISGVEYLIENKIIKVSTYVNKENSTDTIPSWIKNNAGWWADNKINDNDFISGIEYLIENKIIKVSTYVNKENSTDTIPSWIKNNAEWWSSGKISDNDFLTGIEYLIENGIINVNAKTNSELLEKDLERKAWNFERYLINIQSDIKKQNRYVENINPSEYVIIKYWKDYISGILNSFLTNQKFFLTEMCGLIQKLAII